MRKKIHWVDLSKMSSRNLEYNIKNDINENKKIREKMLIIPQLKKKMKWKWFGKYKYNNSTINKSIYIKNSLNKRSISIIDILNKSHKNRIVNSKNNSFISSNQKKNKILYIETYLMIQPVPGYYYNDTEY